MDNSPSMSQWFRQLGSERCSAFNQAAARNHAGSWLVFKVTCACSRVAECEMAALTVECEDTSSAARRRPPPHGRLQPGIRRKASRLKALPTLFGGCMASENATLQFCHTTSRWVKYRFRIGFSSAFWLSWIRSCLAFSSTSCRCLAGPERPRSIHRQQVTKSIRHPRVAIIHGSTNLGTHPWPVYVADSRGIPAALARPMMDSFSATLLHAHLALITPF